MDQKLKDHRTVELPEMLKYYSEHFRDKELPPARPDHLARDRDRKEPSSHAAEARRKAETLLARLKNNEDLATLARTESEGPSRVRAQGGLMQTSPGSYAVEAVNQALANLPLNQISPDPRRTHQPAHPPGRESPRRGPGLVRGGSRPDS